MEFGMCYENLLEGICINEVLVKAPSQSIVCAYGAPHLLYQNGKLLLDASPGEVKVFAGKQAASEWSEVCFPANQEGGDYLIPMFQQAMAALTGEVLVVEECYETPVTIACGLSRKLAVPAIALWGSDEWPGLGGGAFFDARGKLEKVYSMFSAGEIGECLAARQKWPDESGDFPGFGDEGRFDMTFEFIPGSGEKRVEGNVIKVLDAVLKTLKAMEPESPISYFSNPAAYGEYEEVWYAV